MKATGQKGFSAVEVLVGLLVVGVIAFIGWSIMQKQSAPTADKPVTGGSVTSSGRENKPNNPAVSTLTYCTKHEKLCFDYPSDWLVKEQDTKWAGSGAVVHADALTVQNADRAEVLTFDSSYSQLGGACAEEDMADQFVISAEPTKVSGAYLSKDSEQYMLDTVSVLKVISNQASKYYANVYLATDKEFVTQKTVKNCGLFFSPLFKSRNSTLTLEGTTGSTSMQFIATSAAFDTKQQAQEAFKTADMQAAYKVLQSVRYK